MDRETFKQLLRSGGYIYIETDDALVVNHLGYVYLRSCTSLPEGVQFNNSGYVYLRSCTEPQMYRSQLIQLRHIDGSTMRILSEKKVGENTIYRAAYFKGGPLNEHPLCYIAERGEKTAHGDTVRQAIRDLNFKIASEDFDLEDLIEKIRERQAVTFNDYRLITGACESGLRHGLQERGIDPDVEELPLADVIRLCADGFGGREFRAHFSELVA